MNPEPLDTTGHDLDMWLRRHGIYEALDPLEALSLDNPFLLRSVLRMAMMLGIHAGHRLETEGVALAKVEELMKTSRPMWRTWQ